MSVVGEQRRALVVAADEYLDSRLNDLRAPAGDADQLTRILGDPTIGQFEVDLSLNEAWWQVRQKLDAFFGDAAADDLLLLHFSCHGVKDLSGELYFALSDSDLDRLRATAVGAKYVNELMESSRARRVVLFLDCCYSGAFARGMSTRSAEAVDVVDRFSGRGRAVLTASTAMEYAFEGDERSGEGAPSVFTSAVVKGLESGDADRDRDGFVSFDELYDYIYDEVRARTPNQSPSKSTLGMQGRFFIARSPRLAELPEGLRDAVASPFAGVRHGAVKEIEQFLRGDHPGLASAARAALSTLEEDDSRLVSTSAHDALDRASASATSARPEAPAASASQPNVADAQSDAPGLVEMPGGIPALEGPADAVERPASKATATLEPPHPATSSDALRGRRVRLLLILIGVALLVVGVFAAVLLLTRTGTKAAPTSPTADLVPAPSERVGLTVSDPFVFLADPKGRLLQLDGKSLAVRRLLSDPAGPRSLAVTGNRLYTSDGDALVERSKDTLKPTGATRVGPQADVAGDSGTSVAVTVGAKKVCLVPSNGMLGPCARLSFSPSGIGVVSTSHPVVADGKRGRIVLFAPRKSRLVATRSIAVGRQPHGTPSLFRRQLYVPVTRGIAVVDLDKARKVRTIKLPVTPASVWVSPTSGRLFAALPATNRVAVLDTALARSPILMTRVGAKPTAVAGAPAATVGSTGVYVVNVGDRTITTLDALTGRRLRTTPMPVLQSPPAPPLLVKKVSVIPKGTNVSVTMALSRGRLGRGDIAISDRQIKDGAASLELWQGDIRSLVRATTSAGVTARISRLPGRLRVNLVATPGAFSRLRVRPKNGAVVIELTKTPRRRSSPAAPSTSSPPAAPSTSSPPAAPSTSSPPAAPSTSSPPATTSSTVPKTKPAPTAPPTITIG